MKKGLAVFYDPHNVYQFLWYYCTDGTEIEWDALCLPNSFQGDQVSEWIEKLGIFIRVIRHDELYEGWSLGKQLARFTEMTSYAVIGKQKKYAEKTIRDIVGDQEYDTYVILTDLGLISGLFLLYGKDKDVIILEDGTADYMERSCKNILSHLNNTYAWKGFILSRMKYNNFSGMFPLKTTEDCIKYSSHPDKMNYKKYREIRKLYDYDRTDMSQFSEYMGILFPDLEMKLEKHFDAVLFSTPLKDILPEGNEKYYQRVEEYIGSRFKSVLLKKHPRDDHVFDFGPETEVTEIEKSIPAEAFLARIREIPCYFMGPSSCNLYLDRNTYKPSVFIYRGLEEESKKRTDVQTTYSGDLIRQYLQVFDYNDSNVIII